MNAQLLLNLDSELKNRLRQRAEELSLSMTWIVNNAIEDWLDKNENGKLAIVEES